MIRASGQIGYNAGSRFVFHLPRKELRGVPFEMKNEERNELAASNQRGLIVTIIVARGDEDRQRIAPRSLLAIKTTSSEMRDTQGIEKRRFSNAETFRGIFIIEGGSVIRSLAPPEREKGASLQLSAEIRRTFGR